MSVLRVNAWRNTKKEWDSDDCQCGACKQEYVDGCGGWDKIDSDTCQCHAISPLPSSRPTLTITLYQGCFYDGGALSVPLSSYKGTWQYACLGDAYYDDVEDLHHSRHDYQDTIQKLYNCAQDTTNDRGFATRAKQAFIDALKDDNKSCLRGASHPYTITIDL